MSPLARVSSGPWVRFALLRRVVVGVVLAGYALAFSASSTGHGWWLLGHVLTRHHSHGAARSEAETPHAHQEPHPHGAHGPHHHSVAHHHGLAHEHGRSVGVIEAQEATRGSRAVAEKTGGGLHAHGAAVHTHDAEPQPAPVPLVVEIGKHDLPPGGAVPLPPQTRSPLYATVVAAMAHPLRRVETPPPRLLG